MRIVTLLPSATEIVFALGLGDYLVGVSHECDYPDAARRLPAVPRRATEYGEASSREIDRHVTGAVHRGSSLYAMDQALLERLDPDLILTQELCRVCAVSYDQVQRAVRLLPGPRTVASLEPSSLDGIMQSITEVARLTGAETRSQEVTDGLLHRIQRVDQVTQWAMKRPRVFAMEWLDPPFIGGHWVPEMVRLAGGTDGLGREGEHSRKVAWREIVSYDPEVIVFMFCGFDLERLLHELERVQLPSDWARMTAVRVGELYAVNGSAYFNRPGPRVVDGLEILAEVLHPELFPRQKPPGAWTRIRIADGNVVTLPH